MHRRVTRVICAAVAGALISVVPASAASAAGPAQAAGVPAGFQPMSASFVSPSSGFVLGGVGCTHGNPICRARLAATTDGGAQWHFAGAPDVLLFYGAGDLLTQASRVSGVVFANSRDGWLYGPGLYATHDGGAHWQRISLGGNIVPSLGGGVTAMAASAGTAWAVVDPDPFHGLADELYRSPAGTNAWARVGTMTAAQAVFAVSGRAAWFASSTQVGSGEYMWATANGVHWTSTRSAARGPTPARGHRAGQPLARPVLCAFPQGMSRRKRRCCFLLTAAGPAADGPAPMRGTCPGSPCCRTAPR